MFIATLGIAVSVTASAAYLTFYAISAKLRDTPIDDLRKVLLLSHLAMAQ